MRRTLVTGAAGMLGSHLLERLDREQPGAALGAWFLPTIPIADIPTHIAMTELDMRDRAGVAAVMEAERPGKIYHLAAQSLPTVSWTDPWETFRVNIEGTVNLFEAIRAIRARDVGYDPMVVVACSSAQYGASLTPERIPVGEETEALPLHPYGISKVAQDLLAFQYWRNDGIRSIRARIFNTTGPRKRHDVVSDFCARVARIRRDGGGVLRVGNLQTRRAILDVRDLISALMLLAARGEPGEAYNICADQAFRVGDLIPLLEKLAGIRLDVQPDPALFRPSDEPVILGRTDKLKERTAWLPTIGLRETVRAVLEYEIARLER